MPASSATRQVEFRSLDGLRLRGILAVPSSARGPAVVLVHGGGVTREEGGFFARLASGLAESGQPSLRFDFRAHGESEGQGEDLTIAGVTNDIRAAVTHVRELTGSGPVGLIGASFGGGISAFFRRTVPRSGTQTRPVQPAAGLQEKIHRRQAGVGRRPDQRAGRPEADHLGVPGALPDVQAGPGAAAARALALGPELAASGLARRPYDLRHAALSLWLNAGGEPAQIAGRAGNSVTVLLTVYTHCIHGRDDLLNHQNDQVLEPSAGRGPCPSERKPAVCTTAQLRRKASGCTYRATPRKASGCTYRNGRDAVRHASVISRPARRRPPDSANTRRARHHRRLPFTLLKSSVRTRNKQWAATRSGPQLAHRPSPTVREPLARSRKSRCHHPVTPALNCINRGADQRTDGGGKGHGRGRRERLRRPSARLLSSDLAFRNSYSL